jgi:hypothetical protein
MRESEKLSPLKNRENRITIVKRKGGRKRIEKRTHFRRRREQDENLEIEGRSSEIPMKPMD